MATINQTFHSAPLGRRVILPLVAVALIALGALVFNLLAGFGVIAPGAPLAPRILACLVPLVGLLAVVPVFLFEKSRTATFRIDDNTLVLGRKRHALEGLLSAEPDPKALARAVRIWGNGGLGAIRGRFWSRRLGTFHAFLTDTDHAVVLRWPGKTVVVSPSDPQFFIHTAREAAGLR